MFSYYLRRLNKLQCRFIGHDLIEIKVNQIKNISNMYKTLHNPHNYPIFANAGFFKKTKMKAIWCSRCGMWKITQ